MGTTKIKNFISNFFEKLLNKEERFTTNETLSDRLCEDCSTRLPESLKHKCYDCWDNIYLPK